MAFHIDWGIFKRHPYLTAGGAIAIFVIIYYLASSSSSSSTSGDTGGTADDALSAQEAIAGLQANTALSAAQIQAGVQSQAISASQETTDAQTAASLQAYMDNSNNSLSAVQSTNQTQVQLAQVQGNEQDTVVNDLASIVGDQYSAQENQENDVASVLENQTNVAGTVTLAQLSNQGAAINDQYNLDKTAVDNLSGGKSLDRNNTQLSTIVGGLDAALGQSGPAEVAASSSVGEPTNSTASEGIGLGASILQGLVG